MHAGDAFLLLSIPTATLEERAQKGAAPAVATGSLYLECLTIPGAQSPFPDRDVYLVIKLGSFEKLVGPNRTVVASIRDRRSHRYTFPATDSDPEFSISVPLPDNPVASQDLETFNHILTQYLARFSEQRDPQHVPSHLDQKIPPSPPVNDHEYEDLRGHLILVNESDGTVLGDLDHDFKIKEDPAFSRGLPDDASVLIELPPDYDTATAIRAKVPGQEFVPLTSREAFVRAVSPEERDAFTNTATLISHAISATTTLLVSGVTVASKYYVAHSKPHTPSSSPGPSQPRTGILISSPRTRSALTQAHTVSGTAVKVSSKTIDVVDSLIKKAAGRKERPKSQNHPSLPPRQEGKRGLTPPPSASSDAPLPLRPTLRKRDKLILSADVVLSTIEESITRILDTGSEEITRVVAHKRGEESGQNAALATGAVRNVALVYVDLRGVGRKAIVRRFGKEYLKGKLSSGNSNRPRLDQIVAEQSSRYQSSPNLPTANTSKPPLPPRQKK